MRITKDEVVSNADLIAKVLNNGNCCELKIEKGKIAVIEIKRKLKVSEIQRDC